MGKTAIMILQNRVMMLAVAADAVCWGALVFFAIHFFQCQVA
jgi:hypothetical protein